MTASERIIVALDTAHAGQVERLVEALAGSASCYKVGLELYTALGAWAVRFLAGRGHRVMLDLKLHDIPRTVERAVRAASVPGVDLLTVHASGGAAMIRAASDAAHAAADGMGARPRVLAVTVLTSLDDADARAIFGAPSARERVLAFARLAQDAGADGVVASPQEAKAIREATGEDFLIVTPGIRSPGANGRDDQKRVAAPSDAARFATYLVVGRPVTEAPDPRTAFEEIAHALSV